MFLPAVKYGTEKRLAINVNLIEGVEEVAVDKTKIILGGGKPVEVSGSYIRIMAQIKSVMGVEE